jgi:hypothetical protein
MLQRILLFSLFSSQKRSFWKYCGAGSGFLNSWHGKTMLSGYSVYVGDIAGLEEMHNNYVEVTYTGTLNIGFTILSVLPNRVQPL